MARGGDRMSRRQWLAAGAAPAGHAPAASPSPAPAGRTDEAGPPATPTHGTRGGHRPPVCEGRPAAAGAAVTGFDVARDVRIPFLSLSGATDKSPSPEDMKRFVDLVRAGNPNVEMVVYPNAGHAFHADYRPSYQPAAAAAAWEKCLQFFARHLRA